VAPGFRCGLSQMPFKILILPVCVLPLNNRTEFPPIFPWKSADEASNLVKVITFLIFNSLPTWKNESCIFTYFLIKHIVNCWAPKTMAVNDGPYLQKDCKSPWRGMGQTQIWEYCDFDYQGKTCCGWGRDPLSWFDGGPSPPPQIVKLKYGHGGGD